MAFHVAVLSPYAKIFQPRFKVGAEVLTTDDLMRNPDRIHVEEPFTVTVDRSIGSETFVYGVPRIITDETLAQYLTGGPQGEWKQETDHTGLALLPLSPESTGLMLAALTREGGARDLAERAATDATAALEAARLMSHERVMRQVRAVYKLLKRQREQNAEDKKGDAPPTPVEYLCAYVLAAEEGKKSDETKRITEQFKTLMAQIA